MLFKKHIFSSSERRRIIDAIGRAEKLTSGEIRVHIEPACAGLVLDRAADVFHKLGMRKTVLRNGVLIYVAWQDRKLAVIGDKGINEVVPADFWDTTVEKMTAFFRQQKYADGVIQGIEEAGYQLKKYFPYYAGDKNELSNDISEG
ncbi:MAG: TPM domain-containing protein [Bacteroidetes bacterium]|nr:TPM domain-containing protein [Bacteroidota bacterium]